MSDDGLREAARQAHGWVEQAIESTGDSDDDLLEQPGVHWALVICARDALAAALAAPA